MHRPGGPIALVTNRCLFSFDRARRRFRLESVHPGHSVEEVIENTGFDFDRPDSVPVTQAPSADTLRLMRETVGPEIGVKASGGIRNLADARAMLDAGANRLGTSASAAILAALE